MQMLRRMVIWIAIGGLCILASACSGAQTASPPDASHLAADGKTVYQQHCEKCHGADGMKVNGSALMGGENVLPNYQTGQDLYGFISKQMPDDNKGGLTPDQYLQVETYLLLQDGYLKPDMPITRENLDQVQIAN
jgi:mono/diheme cytochrome c family protein